jgi:regulatory protein SWI5
MEERQDKASRTRQRLAEKSSSFDSSGSDTSRHTPPSEVFENMSIHGSSSADEMVSFDNPNYLPPEVFTFTPPDSPNYGMGSKPRGPRPLTPSSEDEMLPTSPSKRPLENILEESGLPPISDAGTCSFSTISSSSTHALSSPHTAPTLSDASQPSDLDIFIHNEPSSAFGKHDFTDLGDPDMATFPEYVNASFDSSLDMLQGKNFSTNPSMGDDFFSFQFQVDEQPSDVMSREFFLD